MAVLSVCETVLNKTFDCVADFLYEFEAIIFWGTLLAQTRNGRLCEGDDDIDFLISRQHKDTLLDRIAPVIANTHTLRLDYSQNIAILVPQTTEQCQVDLYWYDSLDHLNAILQRLDSHLLFPKEQIFPLQSSTLHGHKIWIPNQSDVVCEYMYGPRWTIPISKKDYIFNQVTKILQVQCKHDKIPAKGCDTCNDSDFQVIRPMNSKEHFYQSVQGYASMADQGELLHVICKMMPKRRLSIVEVGVFKGRGTALWNVILHNLGIVQKQWAIDHFSKTFQDKNQKDVTGDYEVTVKNLAPIRDSITIVKNDSESASKQFVNESLDIVYIDAGHEYTSVLKDLQIWWPKVAPGGILCGDDYINGWPGVVRAVDEFFGKSKIQRVGGQQYWIQKL